MPIWRILRAERRHLPPISTSSCGPWPHRQATGMPWMLPLGVSAAGVEVGVGVEPQHAQLLAGLAAVARHGADRADAQAVVAAQQDGQAAERCSSACTASCTAWFQATTSGRWR
jgi:hypothetical protein